MVAGKLRVQAGVFLALLLFWALAVASPAQSTPFTTTVPGTGVQLPGEYPEAGGIAIVMTGANGNIYYQFSNPQGAFVGFQYTGQPAGFRGNPFTINDPIMLDCGFRSCTDYFGGSIARIDIRFSAYDGDTQGTPTTPPNQRGFDYDDINLVMNGFDVGNWSNRTTDNTNLAGTVSYGQVTGFGNNTFNTGWFSSTNPALLNNILTTGRTSTQVRDDDPNDNYWDFTYGSNLPQEDLRTIAPGYELEKTRRGGGTTFAAVGETITYDYVVSNIGSVNIANISVVDDQIGPVTCTPTFLPLTRAGTAPEPQKSLCSATYVITQEDFDNQSVTNIAVASGDPEFGTLGELDDEVTITGPALAPAVTLEKVASPQSFTGPNQTITYNFTVRNTGNTTLTNIVVSDPKIPGLNCTFAQILPLNAANSNNTATCSGTYQTTQPDVDAAAAGTPLTNTATVRARDPNNTIVQDTETETVAGPASMPAMTVAKVAQVADFDAVDDIIPYVITVTNTGNVTWPTPPTVTDSLGIPVSCPAGVVAPTRSVDCTASYVITQPDLDRGEVLNTATATIMVNGVTASNTGSADVDAVPMPALTIEKTLLSGPSPFSATTDQLVYRFEVMNTGNVTIDDVTITDALIPTNCPVVSLAPGDSTVCTSDPYTVTRPI